jgi:DNA-binding MarR family transcriptional regulator
MKSAIQSETPELAYRAFIRSYGLFRNVMEPFFLQFGISGAHWGVLRTLHRAKTDGLDKDGLQLNELGYRLLIRPPSVTSLVDRLERTGLVTRTAALSDHRAKLVSLTSKGEKLIERVLEQHPAQVRTLLAGLDTRQQEEFYDLIQLLSRHMEALAKNKPAVEMKNLDRTTNRRSPIFSR